jgi:hypothetical protein
MKFAKVVFWCAAGWGFLVLTPLFFLYAVIGRQNPPAITHPDFYYGFVGVGWAWQAAFAVIATDPARFRPMMIPSVVEKFSYAAALIILHLEGRVSAAQLPFGGADLLWGILFLAAFFRTKAART